MGSGMRDQKIQVRDQRIPGRAGRCIEIDHTNTRFKRIYIYIGTALSVPRGKSRCA